MPISYRIDHSRKLVWAEASGVIGPQEMFDYQREVPTSLAFGLGRMYQTHRDLVSPGGKQVSVFRTLPAALDWLEIGRAHV